MSTSQLRINRLIPHRQAFTALGILLLTLFTTFGYAASPIGLWQTYDEYDHHKPRSVIQITEQDGKLYGKIVKINFRAGETPEDVCVMCKGPLHNQRILGLTIMAGLQKGQTYWQGGSIVDPENGQRYKCRIKLMADVNQLKVHGYIGIPLLGRTQVWQRIIKHDQTHS